MSGVATVYVRHARSYVFLDRALDAAYGKTLLDGGTALEASGPAAETLRDRIHRVRDLFFGLYLASAFDVGIHQWLGHERPGSERSSSPPSADGAVPRGHLEQRAAHA